MAHGDVKYTPLHTEKTPRWCSRQKLYGSFIILILTLLTLLVMCLNHSNICSYNNIRIRQTTRHLPQCLIIGARKAGTRALLTYLRLHPDIQTAQYEVHFFDNPDNHDFGYEWYKKQMPMSFRDQLTIEKTPAYFTELSVPAKVYKMNSTIKLILIVRDPLERTISDQLQLSVQRKQMGLPVQTFEQLVVNKSNGEINENFKPVTRSFYDIYMKNWLKYFPLKQFYIVDGNILIKDPYSEVYKMESFLGVRHAISQDSFFYNSTKGFYCVRTETSRKCLSATKGRPHPKVDENVIKKMKDLFWEHNEIFYKLINRRFNWNE